MESLGLDWKLVTVQMVNFGILFIILSKFLYKPISKLLEERRKKVEEAISNSQKIEERLLKLEEKEKAVMKKAESDASLKRDELLGLAMSEKEEIIEAAKAAAQKESQKAIENIKSYEEGVYTNIKSRVIKEMIPEIVEKLSEKSKKGKYPLLRKILK